MSSYGELCTEFYDRDKPHAPADAVEYYRQRARDANGPILEPMCGSGRFLLPLLGSGIDIDGVDEAPAMLQACRRHAAQRGLTPVLYLQPIEALALPRRYRMAFIPSGSIGLLQPQALHRALDSLHRHLEPGGVLLLELIQFSETAEPEREQEPRVVQIDEHTTLVYSCRIRPSRDRESIEYEGRYERRHNSEVVAAETESLRVWRHGPQAFLDVLRTCGFSLAHVVEGGAYTSLGANGCFLVEAHTAS